MTDLPAGDMQGRETTAAGSPRSAGAPDAGVEAPAWKAPRSGVPGRAASRAGGKDGGNGGEPRAKRKPGRAAHIIEWRENRFALKVRQGYTSGWRLMVQGGFTFLSLLMGWQFYRFVQAAKATTPGPLPYRPPGVEGYLPISGLMGALDWAYRGVLNDIHPAATILFLLFVLLSLTLRKSFCGWICPVGFLSEWLGRFGLLVLKRPLRVPKWLDVPLRSVKYLLLAFFVFAILGMSPQALHAFIESPYNKVSDIKMLEFFLTLSVTGAVVLAALAVLSIPIHSFWCRYFCPYGALMGLVAWLSPARVRREASLCTDCGICDKVCPARLEVSRAKSVGNVECIGCTDCVVSCPVPGALRYGTRRRTLEPRRIALMIAGVFLLVTLSARVAGWWGNSLSDEEIRTHVAKMHTGAYGHPGMGEKEESK